MLNFILVLIWFLSLFFAISLPLASPSLANHLFGALLLVVAFLYLKLSSI